MIHARLTLWGIFLTMILTLGNSAQAAVTDPVNNVIDRANGYLTGLGTIQENYTQAFADITSGKVGPLGDAKAALKKAEKLKKIADKGKTLVDSGKKVAKNVKGYVDDAKEIVGDVKNNISEVKKFAGEVKDSVKDVKSKVNEGKTMIKDAKSTVSQVTDAAGALKDSAVAKVSDAKTAASSAVARTPFGTSSSAAPQTKTSTTTTTLTQTITTPETVSVPAASSGSVAAVPDVFAVEKAVSTIPLPLNNLPEIEEVPLSGSQVMARASELSENPQTSEKAANKTILTMEQQLLNEKENGPEDELDTLLQSLNPQSVSHKGANYE